MSKIFPKTVLLLVWIVSAAGVVAQQDDVRQKIDQAVCAAGQRNYDRSETLLREVLAVDARNYRAQYELARVSYLRGAYQTTVRLMREALRSDGADDAGYQLLGNACDNLGEADKALGVYERGLKRFPESARLCWEMGKIAENGNDYLRAMEFYERGIVAEPAFAPNYYHVAAIFLSSSEPVWGMLYGEIFLLLERDGSLAERMSRFLYDGYRSGIRIETGEHPGERSLEAVFSRNRHVAYTDDGRLILPYGKGVYESLVTISFPHDAQQVTLDALDRMRRAFVAGYFKTRDQLRGRLAVCPDYPNVLFDFQREAIDAGHGEAYNYWVLRAGDPERFDAWLASHRRQWRAFTEWFAGHPLRLDRGHCFNRLQYEDAAFREN